MTAGAFDAVCSLDCVYASVLAESRYLADGTADAMTVRRPGTLAFAYH